MGGNGLGLSSFADHEELGQDGHRFQVDGEGPEDLSPGPRGEVSRGWSRSRRGPSLKELLKCAYWGECSVVNPVLRIFNVFISLNLFKEASLSPPSQQYVYSSIFNYRFYCINSPSLRPWFLMIQFEHQHQDLSCLSPRLLGYSSDHRVETLARTVLWCPLTTCWADGLKSLGRCGEALCLGHRNVPTSKWHRPDSLLLISKPPADKPRRSPAGRRLGRL